MTASAGRLTWVKFDQFFMCQLNNAQQYSVPSEAEMQESLIPL